MKIILRVFSFVSFLGMNAIFAPAQAGKFNIECTEKVFPPGFIQKPDMNSDVMKSILEGEVLGVKKLKHQDDYSVRVILQEEGYWMYESKSLFSMAQIEGIPEFQLRDKGEIREVNDLIYHRWDFIAGKDLINYDPYHPNALSFSIYFIPCDSDESRKVFEKNKKALKEQISAHRKVSASRPSSTTPEYVGTTKNVITILESIHDPRESMPENPSKKELIRENSIKSKRNALVPIEPEVRSDPLSDPTKTVIAKNTKPKSRSHVIEREKVKALLTMSEQSSKNQKKHPSENEKTEETISLKGEVKVTESSTQSGADQKDDEDRNY